MNPGPGVTSLRVLQAVVCEQVPRAEQHQKQRRQAEQVASGLRRRLQLVKPIQATHAQVDQRNRDKRHERGGKGSPMRDLEAGSRKTGSQRPCRIRIGDAGSGECKPPGHPLFRSEPAGEQRQGDRQEP